MTEPVIVVHGGAGNLTRENVSPRVEDKMREGIKSALRKSQHVLTSGGNALDAVEIAVRELEDLDVFNAGRGSVLASDGSVQMDASIMRGNDSAAGAVACARRIKNPISAARLVMERSAHVILVGDNADSFASESGLEEADQKYFITPARLDQHKVVEAPTLDHDASMGTVGAVARDSEGLLAAATSTGGITNQRPGRVGDSPIVGAGTWADSETCAVSATGNGELILRTCFAHEIDALIRHRGLSLQHACKIALDQINALGGHAGCIALDANGGESLAFTSSGMVRGIVRGSGFPLAALFEGESLQP